MRSDIVAKYNPLFEHIEDDNPISQYIFHCNAQKPR